MKNHKPDPLAKISILIAKQQDIDYGNLVRLRTLQYPCTICVYVVHIKYVFMYLCASCDHDKEIY